ncbi:glycosyltransferase [candidate division KSB1 bacterium]
MEAVVICLIVMSAVYCILSLLLTAGLLIQSEREEIQEPVVSVVIPARNEEDTIERCLVSVAGIDYPDEKLQIIVVDDHSEDDTSSICESISGKFADFTLIRLSELPGAGRGKIAALEHGYREARGEIVVQTDADCIVPDQWLRSLTGRFDRDTGIVGGLTILESAGTGNACFTQVQSLDWTYLLSVGAGANALGFPLSCIGNNLAVRKAAYESVGGYESISFSVTEDFALFKEITRKGWKSRFTVNENSLVRSRPPGTLRDLFRQRWRWATGGIKLAGPGIILLAASFLVHCAMVCSILLGIPPAIWVLCLAATCACDLLFLYSASNKIKRKKLLIYFPLFELYYYLYTIIIGLLIPFRIPVTWKNRSLSIET